MTATEKIALALLRDALGFSREGFDPEMLRGLDAAQWRAVYRFTVRHFVMALVFDRVAQLPKEFMPPREVLIEWMVHADKVAEDNRRIAAATNSLVKLFADNDIHVIVLKGAGIAHLYPNPALREAADVDIYLQGKYAEGTALIQRLGIEVHDHLSEKHNDFVWQGAMFENHYRFVDARLNATERHVEAILKQLSATEKWRTIAIEGGQITIPGVHFNALHVANHTAYHFAGGLIHLRHLDDWAYMLHNGEIDMAALRSDAPSESFFRFIQALTWICIDRLGLDARFGDGLSRDPELEAKIFDEIIASDGKKVFMDKGNTPLSIIRYKIYLYRSRRWKHKLIFNEGSLMRALNTIRAIVARPGRIVRR